MGISTISMVIFQSYVCLPEGRLFLAIYLASLKCLTRQIMEEFVANASHGCFFMMQRVSLHTTNRVAWAYAARTRTGKIWYPCWPILCFTFEHYTFFKNGNGLSSGHQTWPCECPISRWSPINSSEFEDSSPSNSHPIETQPNFPSSVWPRNGTRNWKSSPLHIASSTQLEGNPPRDSSPSSCGWFGCQLWFFQF